MALRLQGNHFISLREHVLCGSAILELITMRELHLTTIFCFILTDACLLTSCAHMDNPAVPWTMSYCAGYSAKEIEYHQDVPEGKCDMDPAPCHTKYITMF